MVRANARARAPDTVSLNEAGKLSVHSGNECQPSPAEHTAARRGEEFTILAPASSRCSASPALVPLMLR